MHTLMEQINSAGSVFVEFAVPMLLQSSVLIAILLLADFLLRKKVRAVFRYWIWMLVLVKLVLPSSLSSPASIGNWFGDKLTNVKIIADKPIKAEQITQRPFDPRQTEQEFVEPVVTAPAVTLPLAAESGPRGAESAAGPLVSGPVLIWQGVVFVVWLAIAAAMVLLLVQRAIFVIGLVGQAKEANGIMTDALKFCCEQMGVRGKIGLKVSANATSPAVCGLFRPVILVPQDLGPSLGAGHLRAVLMHELSHIKRGDLWVNLVQTILQIAYFYNPLLWVANWLIRRVREQAVDEMVLVAMGEKAEQYPQTLIDVAKLAFKRPALSLRLIGVVESKSALAGRIKHIVGRPFPKSAKLGVLGVLIILIAGAVLLPMAKAKDSVQRSADSVQKIIGESNFKATLANGVTVELVGVCEHPSEGKQWWTPDGKRLDYTITTLDKNTYPSDEPGYEFVFRKNGNASFKIESIKGSNVNSGLQVIEPEDLTGYRTHIKKNYKKTNIKIASPSGNWKTAVTSNGKGSVSGKIKGNTIIFAGAEQAGKDVIISCSDIVGYKNATRIIAVDSKGKEIIGQTQTDTGVNNLRQRTIRFATLELSDIAEFRFQTCPYEYYTFKNISLKPTVNAAFKSPEFIVKGTVTDAETGQPIAGAKVSDVEQYGEGKQWTTTGTYGNYSYKTWHEEHGIIVQIKGYAPLEKTLITKLFGKETDKIINFKLTPEKAKNESQFKATLANGVTVELVGVSNYPSNSICWQADGSESEKKLFAKVTTGKREDNFGFVIKFTGPEDMSISYGPVLGALGHSGRNNVVDVNGKDVEEYKALTALIPNGRDSTSVTFGVSAKPWETLATHTGRGGTTTGSKMIIFSQAFETKDSVGITVSTKQDKARAERIVAIDKNGQIHTGDWSDLASNDLQQLTVEFRDVRLNDITEFAFQVRPYEWVEFKNVSLKPNFKTDVQVERENILIRGLQFDVPINITLPEGRYRSPKILSEPVIKFTREDGTVSAMTDMKYASWPEAKWQIRLDILDIQGKNLKSIEDTFKNSGTIETLALEEEQQLKLEIGTWEKLKDASQFIFSLESIWSRQSNPIAFDEKMPLYLQLSGSDTVSGMEVDSVKYEKFAKNIKAVCHAKYLSGPKAKWKLTARILGSNDTTITQGFEIFENSGAMIGVAKWVEKDISILLDNVFPNIEPKRYEVVIERIISEPNSGGQVEQAERNKIPEHTNYVKLILGEDKATFQGKYLSEDINEISLLLANLPDAENTILEWAFAPGTMPEKNSMFSVGFAYGWEKIEKLAEKNHLKGRVCAVEQPLGSIGHTFNGFFNGNFLLSEEIPVNFQSADDLIKCKSIKFDKAQNGLRALLNVAVTSYPKTKWEFRLELRSAKQGGSLALYQTFENSGVIETFPLISDETIGFQQDKFEIDANDIDSFELRIRQIKTTEPGVQVEGENLSFGQQIEVTVPVDGTRIGMFFLDFESGQVISPPPALSNDKAFSKWVIDHGVDAIAEELATGPRLWGFGCVFTELMPERWGTVTPEELLAEVNTGYLKGEAAVRDTKQLPVTFTFKTREGGIGILQIIGFSDDPKGVKICYKMIKKPAGQGEENKTAENGFFAESVLFDALEKGNSLVTAKILSIRPANETKPDMLYFVKAKVIRPIIIGDLTGNDIQEPVELPAGVSFVNALSPGSTYALFISKGCTDHLNWSFCNDFVKMDELSDKNSQILFETADRVYKKTSIRQFRESKLKAATSLPKLPREIIVVCEQFKANPNNCNEFAKGIYESDMGSRQDHSEPLSSMIKYLPPKIILSREEIVFLLGEPTLKCGWAYKWFCGPDKNNPDHVGILSITFDQLAETNLVLYDKNDRVKWKQAEVKRPGVQVEGQERTTQMTELGNSGEREKLSAGGLQDMISSAKAGDTITIPKGLYTELIEITKPLALKGESLAECVFEVTADRPAIFVDTKGKGKVTIEGVTIKWQLATSNKSEYPFALAVKDTEAEVKGCDFVPLGNFQRSPMAVKILGFSKVAIDSCRFDGFGFAVFYDDGTEGSVRDSQITNCQNQGITLFSGAKVEIVGNIVAGSKKHGIRNTGGTSQVKDNLIINNANRGIYLGNKSAAGIISNNVMIGNATGIDGFSKSKVEIKNNIIADSSYAGVGMRDSCRLTIRDNIFKGNERGLILFKEGSSNENTIYRNTFWKNKVDAENIEKTGNSIEAEAVFVDANNGDFSLKSGPVLEQKQGLTDPEVFKALWKRWQSRKTAFRG